MTESVKCYTIIYTNRIGTGGRNNKYIKPNQDNYIQKY